MLNFYYMYAWIWGSIFILYSFRWSAFNKPMSIGMTIFLLLTISISLVVGTLRKGKLKFKRINNFKYKSGLTKIMVAFFLMDFLYAGEVPFITIAIRHSSQYMNYQGIPMLHVFIVAAGALYSIYLFYLYLNETNKKKKKRVGIDFLILLSMFLLMFYRGMIIMIGYSCLIMLIAVKSSRIFNRKNIFRAIPVVLICLFLFGVLGNIRSGLQWNDNSLIEQMGRYNDNYPAFLPKEYMWSYSYITSPLANLNNSTINESINYLDIQEFIYSVIPDFISKRLQGTDTTLSRELYNLMAEYFNASTGFIESYYAGSYLAMYIYFFIEMIVIESCLYLCKGTKYYTVALAVANLIVAFTFFNNTLTYSALSLQLALIIIVAKLSKVRILFGGRVISGGNE